MTFDIIHHLIILCYKRLFINCFYQQNVCYVFLKTLESTAKYENSVK